MSRSSFIFEFLQIEKNINAQRRRNEANDLLDKRSLFFSKLSMVTHGFLNLDI